MEFLRRILGADHPADAAADPPADPAELDALERQHELDIARSEQDRLDDLQQRQLRYEGYAWQPPAQGGDRRAEDGDADAARRD